MKHISNIRPWMVAAGIVVVIGLLASVCAVFPENGIALTEETSLRFPTLTEMLQGDTTSTDEAASLSPEQLLAKQQQEMHMKEEQQYIDYFTGNPVRIHFPNNDMTYLDPVYEALETANRRAVRIVHFGDSQLEEDRMSCNLRLALQKQFGGGGNGLLPWKESLYSQTINLSSARTPQRYQVYGPKSSHREGNTCYGPMGSVSQLDSTMTVCLSPKKKNGHYTVSHYFNRLTLLSQSGSTIRMSAQGQTVSITPANTRLQMTHINLKDSTTSLNITLSGKGDIYGFMLDNRTGVSVDNIPMRGCSGTVFTGIDASQLRTYFSATNTKLIILQFGGNSVPYLKAEKAIDGYIASLRRQLRYVKQLAPDARILWVGPSDMTTRINGKMQTYPMLKTIDRKICAMVNSEGCAYWSLFDSMGGAGSMIRWANAKPAMAGKDYIHFTRLGATRAGELLTDAFLTGYRYYEFRFPKADMPTDSIGSVVTVEDAPAVVTIQEEAPADSSATTDTAAETAADKAPETTPTDTASSNAL